MYYSSWATVCVALLASNIPAAFAQTFTDCNPLEKTCPADPSMGAGVETDFRKVSGLPSGWTMTSGALSYDSSGAKFTVGKQGDSPTVQTSGYFFFGYCEVKMKASVGQGIVSSIVLESDDLDEVDWEWIGGNTAQVQTNYFGKGDTSTYDRAIWHPVATPQSTWHTYAVNWTTSSISWIVDGVVIRNLNYADAKAGSRFPQTPMRLKIGIWAGGDPNNSKGTIDWSGGLTDFSGAPYSMTVESVKVVNYSPGSSYVWGDKSGSWQSIQVVGGTPGGNTNPSGQTTLRSTTAASGSKAIMVSTATRALTTSTAGAVIATSAPVVPLLGSTTAVEGTANATLTSSARPTASTQSSSQARTFDADFPLVRYISVFAAAALFASFM